MNVREMTADAYCIYFDDELGSVVMNWNGYSTSDQFKEGTELMLNVLILHKCSNVLADIRNMVLIGREDQKWLEHYFLPRAIGFGFKRIAILTPVHYFNRVAVESISGKVDESKLKIAFFEGVETARNWLLEADGSPVGGVKTPAEGVDRDNGFSYF